MTEVDEVRERANGHVSVDSMVWLDQLNGGASDEEAVRLALAASAQLIAAPSATYEEQLQLALAASMISESAHATSDYGNDETVARLLRDTGAQSEKERKELEEMAARLRAARSQVLEDKHPAGLVAAVCEATTRSRQVGVMSSLGDGLFVLGDKVYHEVDRGSLLPMADGGVHTHACYYLAACGGDRWRAAHFKEKVATLADAAARSMGATDKFMAEHASAQYQVVWAHVLSEKRAVRILQEDMTVLEFATGACAGKPCFVRLRAAHYTELCEVK